MRYLRVLILLFAGGMLTVAYAQVSNENFTFDTVYDEFISKADPRVCSLILVANQRQQVIAINYHGYDGQQLAKRLQKIFQGEHVQFVSVESASQISTQVGVRLVGTNED